MSMSSSTPPDLSSTAHTFVHLSLPPGSSSSLFQPPSSALLTSRSSIPITYVSKVGELEGEHIFSIEVPSGSSEWDRIKDEVFAAVEAAAPGGKGGKVEVMAPKKQRVKRGGEF